VLLALRVATGIVRGIAMATEIDEREHPGEPGMGLALLTVFGIIGTIAVLAALIWILMIGVSATTAGRHAGTAAGKPAGPMIEQKASPAQQP
jgi:hypothetical protein